MADKKYVVQMDVRGSNAPISKLMNKIPSNPEDDSAVYADEHSANEGTTEDGTPQGTAHVPYHAESDAKSKFDELKAIQGALNSADSGSYIHYHECPTGGGPDAWDCSERVIDEVSQ